MSEQKKFFRWEPQSLFVSEILNAEKVEITDKVSALKAKSGLYFKRTSLVGVVVEKSIAEGSKDKKEFAIFTIDDATANIKCMIFESSDFAMIRDIGLGDTVLIQGMAYKRKYKNEDDYYVVPEVVRKIERSERDLLLLRTLLNRVRDKIPLKVFPTGIEPLLARAGITVTESNGRISLFTKPTDQPTVEPNPPTEDEPWILIFLRGKEKVAYESLINEATNKNEPQDKMERDLINLVNKGKVEDIDGESLWFRLKEEN